MASLPFTAVFLDTSICLPAWPNEPAGLADLISTIGLFSVPVILPGPVELELRGHCLRKAAEEIQTLIDSQTQMARFVRSSVEIKVPTPDAIAEAFDHRAAETKRSLGLEVSPFSTASLHDLFSDAVQHSYPFEKEGKNFQDAVILRSICEYCSSSHIDSAAFVSKNKQDFKPGAVKRFGEQAGVSLTLLTSVSDVHEAFWPSVQELLKIAWGKDKDVAKARLTAVMSDIERFLRSRFVKTEEVQLRLLSLGDVITGFPNRIKSPSEKKTPITFETEVRFQGPGEFVIDRGITVDGWADYEDGEYTTITMESAEITR